MPGLYLRSMKPWKRFVFVFIAYAMALLHTAVPHQHVATGDGTTISTAGCSLNDSMGGFLQMIFSTDLGYGHLETFQKSAGADVDFSFSAVFIIVFSLPLIISFTLIPVRALSWTYIEKRYKGLLLFSSRQFRAPPAVC